MHTDHNFIFNLPNAGTTTSARKIHILRLYDILNVCLQRHDRERAKRAWSILARCYEVHWMTLWSTAIDILGDDMERTPRQIGLLRALMLQFPEDRETLLRELVLHLIVMGRYRDALDELELYLPSFPYQDNPIFHLYAGLVSFHMAQKPSEKPQGAVSWNDSILRSAQLHFGRVLSLSPGNSLAQGFIDKINQLSEDSQRQEYHEEDVVQPTDSSDDDESQRSKRIRT